MKTTQAIFPYICSAVVLFTLVAAPALSRAQNQSTSVEEALRRSGEGVGRFRGGLYGSVGGGMGSKINVPNNSSTRPAGFYFEGGGYGLFNPIRDFADIEAGFGISYLTPTSTGSNGGAVEYKTGFVAGTAYLGPLFRIGKSGSAFGFGAQVLLGNKVLKDSNDVFANTFPGKMKSALGVYGEYQYKTDASKAIYYTRMAVNRYDVTFQGAPASVNDQGKGNTMVNLQIGIKY
jgi:hypothetical protein